MLELGVAVEAAAAADIEKRQVTLPVLYGASVIEYQIPENRGPPFARRITLGVSTPPCAAGRKGGAQGSNGFAAEISAVHA